jgi:hypothetical protein
MWLAVGGIALYLYSQRSIASVPFAIGAPQPVRTDTGIKTQVLPINTVDAWGNLPAMTQGPTGGAAPITVHMPAIPWAIGSQPYDYTWTPGPLTNTPAPKPSDFGVFGIAPMNQWPAAFTAALNAWQAQQPPPMTVN